MPTGTVIFLLETRNFGFIKKDDEPNDLFFHKSKIVSSDADAIHRGSRVTFEIETAPNGKPQATHVRLVEQPHPTDDALASLAWEHRKGEQT